MATKTPDAPLAKDYRVFVPYHFTDETTGEKVRGGLFLTDKERAERWEKAGLCSVKEKPLDPKEVAKQTNEVAKQTGAALAEVNK